MSTVLTIILVLIGLAILVVLLAGLETTIFYKLSKRPTHICYHTKLDCENCVSATSCTQVDSQEGLIETKEDD